MIQVSLKCFNSTPTVSWRLQDIAMSKHVILLGFHVYSYESFNELSHYWGCAIVISFPGLRRCLIFTNPSRAIDGVTLSVHPCLLSVHLSGCLSVYPSICPSIRPSIHPSISPSISDYICLYIHLALYFCICACSFIQIVSAWKVRRNCHILFIFFCSLKVPVYCNILMDYFAAFEHMCLLTKF